MKLSFSNVTKLSLSLWLIRHDKFLNRYCPIQSPKFFIYIGPLLPADFGYWHMLHAGLHGVPFRGVNDFHLLGCSTYVPSIVGISTGFFFTLRGLDKDLTNNPFTPTPKTALLILLIEFLIFMYDYMVDFYKNITGFLFCTKHQCWKHWSQKSMIFSVHR